MPTCHNVVKSSPSRLRLMCSSARVSDVPPARRPTDPMPQVYWRAESGYKRVSTLALLDRTGRQAGDDSTLKDDHQQNEGH